MQVHELGTLIQGSSGKPRAYARLHAAIGTPWPERPGTAIGRLAGRWFDSVTLQEAAGRFPEMGV